MRTLLPGPEPCWTLSVFSA